MKPRVLSVCSAIALGALALAGGAAAAAPQNEVEAMARALGTALPAFPQGDALEALVKDAARHPLGSADNPVRVGTIRDSYGYIGRLRCADGSGPKRARIGPAAKAPFGRIVDAYSVDCGAAAPGAVVVHVDAYHGDHQERRAPPGLRLSPAAARPG